MNMGLRATASRMMSSTKLEQGLPYARWGKDNQNEYSKSLARVLWQPGSTPTSTSRWQHQGAGSLST